MAKYCPMCGKVTNCTENCKDCLAEETNSDLYEDLNLEQNEQM